MCTISQNNTLPRVAYSSFMYLFNITAHHILPQLADDVPPPTALKSRDSKSGCVQKQLTECILGVWWLRGLVL